MMKRKHLIIGAGRAAISAAEAIRTTAPEDEIKLLSRETVMPYSPAALDHLLSGKIKENALWLKAEQFFKEKNIVLSLNTEVTGILPDKGRVELNDGSSESYDRLLIATGSEPAQPLIPGLDEADAHVFRTLSDCRRLMQALPGKKHVAILGAGMVGMKVAGALLELGKKISIIERELTVLPLYFNEEAETYIKEIFINHGALFYPGWAVVSIKKESGGDVIQLSDGSIITADLLVNTAGVRSRTACVAGSGIRVNEGILTDTAMRTSETTIYAAGDVAESKCFFTGHPRINAIIPSAVAQGQVAGINMAGGSAEFSGGIPATAFNFLGNLAYSIGLTGPQTPRGTVHKMNDDAGRKFKKLIFEGDYLVGGMFVNEKADAGLVHYLIQQRVNLSEYKAALFERTQPLKDPWLSSLKIPVSQ